MIYTVREDTLADLAAYRASNKYNLNWSSPFVLPAWMQVWWQGFGGGAEIMVRTVRQGEDIIGIAPLMLKQGTVRFIGDTDVCDYQDFITAPGAEQEFCHALLDGLKKEGQKDLDLGHVLQGSTVLHDLVPIANGRGYQVVCEQEDVTLEMELHDSWEGYLGSLNTKQRHEVRRKLRRLLEAGTVKYRVIDDETGITAALDTFLRMFAESRQDKAAFLTGPMEAFFREMVTAMQATGLLKLGILELDDRAVAGILCFDYNNCIYLYNSGYDPGHVSLSVGLMSKVMAIKDGIEKGRDRFDFLKGAETYKYRLGGREEPLYRCRINIA